MVSFNVSVFDHRSRIVKNGESPLPDNFLAVYGEVYSGGELQGTGVFHALSELGIQTIISVDGAMPDIEANYGFRYYNSSTGAWLSRDPIGETGGQNLHGFIENDPVNLVDSYGKVALIPLLVNIGRAESVLEKFIVPLIKQKMTIGLLQRDVLGACDTRGGSDLYIWSETTLRNEEWDPFKSNGQILMDGVAKIASEHLTGKLTGKLGRRVLSGLPNKIPSAPELGRVLQELADEGGEELTEAGIARISDIDIDGITYLLGIKNRRTCKSLDAKVSMNIEASLLDYKFNLAPTVIFTDEYKPTNDKGKIRCHFTR